ncbi:hypothetical protein [Rhizobium sp. LjRoot258]|uniref:hypothetical protein n=1 Tax=Rhizobium sp. LjRoot258 TaxID=3342299 RepID=UPI003ECE7C4D
MSSASSRQFVENATWEFLRFRYGTSLIRSTPAIATRIGTRQRLSVSSQEIETALAKDASTGE